MYIHLFKWSYIYFYVSIFFLIWFINEIFWTYCLLIFIISHYERDTKSAITPPISITGKAIYISPPTTIKIRITGNNTTVQSSFSIPQDALIPNIKNFPINQIIQIPNSNDNIFCSLLLIFMICVIYFCFWYNFRWIVQHSINLLLSLYLSHFSKYIFNIKK